MRVIMVNYSEVTSPGGVHKTIVEIARNLYIRGHEVIIFQANSMNLPTEEIYEGFKIIRVKSILGNKLYGFHLELFFFIKKYCMYLKPDLIHIHGYHTLFSPELIYLFKKLYPNVPLVFSPHFGVSSHSTVGGKYLWSLYNKLVGRKISQIANVIVAASNFEASNISKFMFSPQNKIIVIPHGVNVIDLSSVNYKGNRINLLYVGYLLELKGVQYIIKSLQILIFRGFNVQLTIVGEGPYESDLKKLANELNVNNYIIWTGFMPSHKLTSLYKNSNILLLTSKSENYGIVVGEALAVGTPVIVTKIPALMEFLNEPGCFGIGCPPKSDKLSELILYVNSIKDQVGPFSKKIRTWDQVAKEYERVYFKLI